MLLKLKPYLKSILLQHVAARRLRRDTNYECSSVRTILVLRFDRIGDMVVTTPLFSQLRQIFPTSEISVLCSKSNAPVILHNPHVSNRPVWAPGVAGLKTLLRIRKRHDLVIDLNHSVIWRDLLIIRLLSPRWAASVFKEGRYGVPGRKLPIYRLMPGPDRSPDKRIARKYQHLAEYLGGKETHDFRYEIFLPPNQQRDGVQREQERSKLFWVVNQHGGRPQMSIRSDDLRSAIEILLNADSLTRVMWVSSPVNYASVRSNAAHWFGENPRVLTPEPTDDVMDTVRLLSLQNCLGLVTPDTSLIHFASAFKRPTVIIFANEPELYAQWSPPNETWSQHIFSDDPKSLMGYQSSELLSAVKQMTEFVARSATVGLSRQD